MPERVSSGAAETLLALAQALESNDLESADRLSRVLHGQVTTLSPSESTSLRSDLNHVISAARSRRRQLGKLLRERRSTRQGVVAYQSVIG